MSRRSPYRIELTPEERSELERRVRRQTATKREVFRAQIVVLAADGLRNDEIAERLGTARETVSRWRKRYFDERTARASLIARGAAGRGPFPPRVVVEIKALACERPADLGLPLARLSQRGDRPGRGRPRTSSRRSAPRPSGAGWARTPAAVALPQLDLPARPGLRAQGRAASSTCIGGRWQGEPLRPDEHVVCADEKTSIQARARIHPGTPPRPGRAGRVEHEYKREGALAYLAAWDVRRAQVFGRCEPTTGIEPFGRLVDQVMSAGAVRQRPGGCSGSSTTAARIAARAEGAAARALAADPGSSTPRSTPPGSTRSSSTSASCSARSSSPTSGPRSPSSRPPFTPSPTTTARSPNPSNGASPGSISTASWRPSRPGPSGLRLIRCRICESAYLVSRASCFNPSLTLAMAHGTINSGSSAVHSQLEGSRRGACRFPHCGRRDGRVGCEVRPGQEARPLRSGPFGQAMPFVERGLHDGAHRNRICQIRASGLTWSSRSPRKASM